MNQFSQPANGFIRASLILGICALLSVFTMTVIPPMVLGSLSIILGLLSRGDTRFPHNHALIGMILSCSAFVINIAICAFAFYYVLNNAEMMDLYLETLDQTYEQMMGFSFTELLENYELGGILK